LAATPSAWKDIERVIIVVLENTKVEDALNQPFQKELAQKGAFFSNYFAVTHPSQPNYIAMIAGSTFGVDTNSNVTLSAPTIADLLERAGKTWRVYADDYPGNCYLGASHNLYVRKHLPFLSFASVQNSPEKCANIVSSRRFRSDVVNNGLPTYSLFVPNLDNDGHDTSPAYADRWLKKTFGAMLMNTTLMKSTLFVVTYDEDDDHGNNQIFTVFVGDSVRAGVQSNTLYDHYSLLRTIEDIFGLGTLHQNDERAAPILDVWKVAPNLKQH